MKKIVCALLAVLMIVSLAACAKEPVDTTSPEVTETMDAPEVTDAPEATPEAQTTEETDTPDDVAEVAYQQSPFLDGKGLPDVVDRLPKVPKVANEMSSDPLSYYEEGKYGGTFHTGRVGGAGSTYDPSIFILTNEPLVNSPGLLGEEITANVLESYEVSADQKVFTFKLREGMKWSDGTPVTMDDVKYAWSCLTDKVLYAGGIPDFFREEGKPSGADPKVTFVDDWTFTFQYEKPYGGLLLALAIEGWRGHTDLIMPKHYLEQFDYRVASEEDMQKFADELSITDPDPEIRAVQVFGGKRTDNWTTLANKAIGYPVLNAWVIVKGGDIIEMERNPYYFKVDSYGNQLPYFDKVESILCADIEMMNMKILGGELDHSYEYASIPKLSLYTENRDAGKQVICTNTTLHRTSADLTLNLCKDDAVWQETVSNVDFRKAMSMALDREDMAQTGYSGYAKASAVQPVFDLDGAKALLDSIGMAAGSDGKRTSPSGKKFSILFDGYYEIADMGPVVEIGVENWKELGIDVTLKSVSGELRGQKIAANEVEAAVFYTSGPVMWFWPDWGQWNFGRQWMEYYNNNGEKGIEPPADVREFFDLIYSVRGVSLEEAKANGDKLRKILGEKYYFYITCDDVAQPVIINAKMGNHKDEGYEIGQNFGGEMWFYKD